MHVASPLSLDLLHLSLNQSFQPEDLRDMKGNNVLKMDIANVLICPDKIQTVSVM
jgi:hypothetical protein